MPRPRKRRCVEMMPGITYFKPRGVPLRFLEEVVLTVEELEAIRLKDLEDLEGEQAAERMRVSRPTFQRILESARRKIADALVGGKALRIQGGDFEIAARRFQCSACRHEWEVPFGTGQRGVDVVCPICQYTLVRRVDRGPGWVTGSCRAQGCERARTAEQAENAENLGAESKPGVVED